MNFVKICFFILAGCYFYVSQLQAQTNGKIKNPVAADGADPWAIQFEKTYYYCYSDDESIHVNKSGNLDTALQMNEKNVWQPEAGKEYSKEIWAPELHRVDGQWFIYFAADNGDNNNHKMYVLESKTGDPCGEYFLRGRIFSPSDKWAIDGTVLQINEKLYFIWSGWEGDVNVQQNLYIAEMENPWTIKSERVLISKPEYEWERIGEPFVNEGPEVLKNGEKTFIIYSASGSWTDSYCLGRLELIGSEPMDQNSWKKKSTPVFSGTENIFSPGHASFVKTPVGSEDWIVYHSAKHKGAGWDRNIRIQKFHWGENGEPNFGKPIDDNVEFDPPSELKPSEICGCSSE